MNVTSEKKQCMQILNMYIVPKRLACNIHNNKNNSFDLLQLMGRMHNNFKNFPKFMHNFIKDNLKEARCLISVA